MSNNQRKVRLQVYSELGLKQSLSFGDESFVILNFLTSYDNNATQVINNNNPPQSILILGLGDDPNYLLSFFKEYNLLNIPVFYLETEQFLKQMNKEYLEAIPPNFKRIHTDELEEILDKNPIIIQHKQLSSLFPSFWWRIINKIEIYLNNDKKTPKITSQEIKQKKTTQHKCIFLVSTKNNLLHFELNKSFIDAGFKVIQLDKDYDRLALKDLIIEHNPLLYFSLNCEGFGNVGEKFFLLQELGVKCASWLVDNPWNIITLLKSNFWQELNLFCTDKSFIPSLQEVGAKKITHLPLACDPSLFNVNQTVQNTITNLILQTNSLKKVFQSSTLPILFVGHSAFSNKQGFFAGLKLPIDLEEKAKSFYELDLGERPDFFWWLKNLNINLSLTNKEFRLASLGADNCSVLWRVNCIKTLEQYNPVVYGDAGWHAFLSKQIKINQPVDYYTALPKLYTTSLFTLNATSFLLPEGLNQRCFDVWGAGGFLLTDYHKGMDIFPEDLVKAVSFKTKNQLPSLLNYFLENYKVYLELKSEWQNLILKEHSYKQRIDFILTQLFY